MINLARNFVAPRFVLTLWITIVTPGSHKTNFKGPVQRYHQRHELHKWLSSRLQIVGGLKWELSAISSASRRPLNRDVGQGVGTSEPTVKM